MTEPHPMTAALLQLAGLAQQLADLDQREASDVHDLRDQVTALASLAASLKDISADQAQAIAASLGDCWDQHPLCLYLLDWLSELWSVLYLQPARTPGQLAGQAEWQTRLLTAAADQLARETRATARTRPRAAG